MVEKEPKPSTFNLRFSVGTRLIVVITLSSLTSTAQTILARTVGFITVTTISSFKGGSVSLNTSSMKMVAYKSHIAVRAIVHLNVLFTSK